MARAPRHEGETPGHSPRVALPADCTARAIRNAPGEGCKLPRGAPPHRRGGEGEWGSLASSALSNACQKGGAS